MSTQTLSKKRKSTDGTTVAAKKAKTTTSAEKPAPIKSALKKSSTEPVENTNPAGKKTKESKATNTVTRNGTTTQRKEKTTVEDDDDGGTELTSDQTAALLAGFSSSEDEGDSEDEAGVAVSSLPKAPTTGLIQKRIKQAVAEQNDPEITPGVIYIGRIPHGFYEQQMKAYFSQFGEISKLRLARNRKTGNSKHYAFVEFASAAVADIVAKTMDKYLMFGHILQVRRVPKEQVKEEMFMGRKKKPPPRNRLEGTKLRHGATREEWEKRVEKENKRRAEKAEKLKQMGYEFEMPAVKAVSEVPVKPKQIDEAATSAEIDGGTATLEDGKPAATTVEEIQTAQVEGDGVAITKEAVTKKRPVTGKPATKKVVKKVKA